MKKNFVISMLLFICLMMTACFSTYDDALSNMENSFFKEQETRNNESTISETFAITTIPDSFDGSNVSYIDVPADDYWTQSRIEPHDDPTAPREFTVIFNGIEYYGKYISSYTYVGDNYQIDRYSAKEQKCSFFINHNTKEPVRVWVYTEDFGYGENLISKEEAIESAKEYLSQSYNVNSFDKYEITVGGGIEENENQLLDIPYTVYFNQKIGDIYLRCGYIIGLNYDGSVISVESYMNQTVEKIISDNNESYLQMCIQLLCTPDIEKTVLDAITVEEGKEYTKTITDRILTFDGNDTPVYLIHILVEYTYSDEEGTEYSGAEGYIFTIRNQ